MPSQEEIDKQLKLLATYRRRLAHNVEQQAKLGIPVPFSLVEDIRETRAEIRRIKATLRGWEIAIEDLPDDMEAPADSPTSASEQAGAGLTAMAELLVEPGVRAVMEGFRGSFEIVCQQIDRLSNYKDLHDLLHDLQFNCYNPIVRGARDFPNNALFLEGLVDYEAELQKIVNSLWEVVERATFLANEQAWIRQLGLAGELLGAAIDERSRTQLDRATFQIGRVLYVHPSRINERLKEAARPSADQPD
jgi:hypothetical protein